MDDIDVIRALRPTPPGPSPAERAVAKEHLMKVIEQSIEQSVEPGTDHVDDGRRAVGDGAVVPAGRAVGSGGWAPPTAPVRGNELEPVHQGHERRARRGRRVAMVGVAAAVVVGAVVVGFGVAGQGPGPLGPPVAAADQLRAAADLVDHTDPYPAGSYSVRSRTEIHTPPGSDATRAAGIEVTSIEGTADVVSYATGGGDYLMVQSGCAVRGGGSGGGGLPCGLSLGGGVEDPDVASNNTAAGVRAVVQQRVDAVFTGAPASPSKAWYTMWVVGRLLPVRSLSAGERAELLRILADTAPIAVEQHVSNAFGLEGTRFTVSVDGAVLEVIVDPTDGYLLQSSVTVGPGLSVGIEPGMTEYVLNTSESWTRPVALTELPADVARAADAVRAHHEPMEAEVPGGGCVGGAGARFGFDLPADITFTHCWRP